MKIYDQYLSNYLANTLEKKSAAYLAIEGICLLIKEEKAVFPLYYVEGTLAFPQLGSVMDSSWIQMGEHMLVDPYRAYLEQDLEVIHLPAYCYSIILPFSQKHIPENMPFMRKCNPELYTDRQEQHTHNWAIIRAHCRDNFAFYQYQKLWPAFPLARLKDACLGMDENMFQHVLRQVVDREKIIVEFGKELDFPRKET